jgi:hypothetical protein
MHNMILSDCLVNTAYDDHRAHRAHDDGIFARFFGKKDPRFLNSDEKPPETDLVHKF